MKNIITFIVIGAIWWLVGYSHGTQKERELTDSIATLNDSIQYYKDLVKYD